MIEYDRYNWLRTVLSYRGTALRPILGRVAALTGFAVVVQLVYDAGIVFGRWDMSHFFGLEPVEHAVLGSLLGFLIVFRMNASNNRYWEGRSLWGQMINSSRNLVRAGVAHTDGGA
ncbi:MAG: bestrophin family ion channel, partial [Deltaproteobacteria bacterium]